MLTHAQRVHCHSPWYAHAKHCLPYPGCHTLSSHARNTSHSNEQSLFSALLNNRYFKDICNVFISMRTPAASRLISVFHYYMIRRNKKHALFQYLKKMRQPKSIDTFGLIWFYVTSTIVDYLMPKTVYTYIK